MFDEFAKNILAANGGNSGNIYQNYSASKINAAPAAVAGNQAAVQAKVDEQERQNQLEIADKQKAVEDQRKADAEDPSKAQMIMKPDGSGYYFRDGTGKEMNINQFSLLTGKRPDELLADSDNPRDQKFVQDYKTMKDISSAWVNGDNETLQKYRAADPQKFNEIVSNYKTPSDMVRAFMGYYSDYYGSTTGKNTAESGTFSPGQVTGPDKAMGKKLAGTTLDQTLAPINTAAPRPLNLVERLNPFAGQKDAINRYKEQSKANPWLAYHSLLTGR